MLDLLVFPIGSIGERESRRANQERQGQRPDESLDGWECGFHSQKELRFSRTTGNLAEVFSKKVMFLRIFSMTEFGALRHHFAKPKWIH